MERSDWEIVLPVSLTRDLLMAVRQKARDKPDKSVSEGCQTLNGAVEACDSGMKGLGVVSNRGGWIFWMFWDGEFCLRVADLPRDPRWKR